MGEREIAEQVRALLASELGEPVEDQLLAGGVIDSLRSVDLALSIEEKFALGPGELAMDDLATISVLAKRIHQLLNPAPPSPSR